MRPFLLVINWNLNGSRVSRLMLIESKPAYAMDESLDLSAIPFVVMAKD
jgi:hypothetical protein